VAEADLSPAGAPPDAPWPGALAPVDVLPAGAAAADTFDVTNDDGAVLGAARVPAAAIDAVRSRARARTIAWLWLVAALGCAAAASPLAAWRGLDLKDAGRVDLRSDAHGLPHFMEVNSLAGLNPVRSDLCILCKFWGITYHELISSIIDSAFRRTEIQ